MWRRDYEEGDHEGRGKERSGHARPRVQMRWHLVPEFEVVEDLLRVLRRHHRVLRLLVGFCNLISVCIPEQLVCLGRLVALERVDCGVVGGDRHLVE